MAYYRRSRLSRSRWPATMPTQMSHGVPLATGVFKLLAAPVQLDSEVPVIARTRIHTAALAGAAGPGPGPTQMSHGGHGGHGADSDESLLGYCADSAESRREHAGYQCLGCRQTWSTLFALGQHTGSPYLRGTTCGTQNSAAELRNVPRAHLATGQAQAVPIYPPGTQRRSNTGSK